MEIVTSLGIIATFVGAGYAIYQVHKTKSSLKAVAEAQKRTEGQIRGNVLIADISTLDVYVSTIREYLRNGDLKPALLRLSDLKGNLVRLLNMNSDKGKAGKKLKEAIDSLQGIEVNIEKRMAGEAAVALDLTAISRMLSEISTLLNEIKGKEMYRFEKGTK
ncbi:MAG: hypothetical protein KAT79_01480 [candidate division Zixibacteria bacterium]|nr:hypothetical protein [candidate division Zixibacteria bacterium]